MTQRAFTLIELLVTLLIISVLAAAATVQYRNSLDEVYFKELIIYAKAFSQARNRYFLETGQFPTSRDELDVELPEDKTFTDKININFSSTGQFVQFTHRKHSDRVPPIELNTNNTTKKTSVYCLSSNVETRKKFCLKYAKPGQSGPTYTLDFEL